VAHNVERNLVVVLLEPVELAPVLSGEAAAVIPIGRAQVGGAQDRFKPEDGWRLISPPSPSAMTDRPSSACFSSDIRSTLSTTPLRPEIPHDPQQCFEPP
jgi:hypothetical protein